MFGKYLNYFFSGDIWLKSKHTTPKVEKESPPTVLKVKENQNIKTPFGYIECELKNITIERLHQEHNILLKSISIETKLFIQTIVLLNEPKEFDCYADGENEHIEIKEIDDNLLSVTVREKVGNVEKFYIRSGKIEIKL